jgi:predicted ATPase
MKTLILEGVRAFRDRVDAPLGKLTLLVGENSTGKSTVLACTRIAWDIANQSLAMPVEFNEDPFELGTYESIAHHHGGKGKCVGEFTIGAEMDVTRGAHSTEISHHVEATFDSDKGNPAFRTWLCRAGPIEVRAERMEQGKVRVRVSDGQEVATAEVDVPPTMPLPRTVFYAPEMFTPRTNLWRGAVDVITRVGLSHFDILRPAAFAPVRSRPRRTYDPIHQRPDAEGQHIPTLLARLHHERGRGWKRVSGALRAFGKASGLFDRISVRSLGKEGDPFQIEIDVPGQKGSRNLLDVGYGVSQVLPVLVEGALTPKGGTLLFQQPEVHLHPRAQAELGTLLATLAAQGPQCIVETHSDYLIDRVAMAVRDPNHPLKPDDVSLLYFQPSGTGVTIYPLRLDAGGDVVDPPPEYRRFFLHEHARYLGLDDEDGA